ncbi:MAG TPA: 4-hydroxybenzoate octaprenyltransferase [Usitatibacter sp.]|jgi:4-hydroxybenzoate polyprenyltransferase|nr:4-hydroxybenzoate octaprenyltransferase [Usitatibacter sp.]
MNALVARLDAYERLLRLDKPVGALLLLWPTLWGVWIASDGRPPWQVVWIFVLGTFVMRSAGCALNDWADRDFDAHVKRTEERPLAAGTIRPWEALVLAALLALGAFALVLKLDALALYYSFAALAIAIVYPFLKRFFWMPQAFLGIAFGFGIPMAFAAIRNEVPPLAWALVLANVFWTIAYDTEYAMVDRDDDMKIGMRTSAILFGRLDVAAVMACYALFIATMGAIGRWQGYRGAYFAGVAAAGVIALLHYSFIRTRSREGCFRAFRHNTWIGFAVLAGLVLDLTDWHAVVARWAP